MVDAVPGTIRRDQKEITGCLSRFLPAELRTSSGINGPLGLYYKQTAFLHIPLPVKFPGPTSVLEPGLGL